TVGKDEVRAVPEFLDDAEDVVPAARDQSARVLAKLIEDLFHLECSEDLLDEHGGADRSSRDVQRILREVEHVVPQPSLEVALELREIEVGAVPFAEKPLGV